MVTDERAEIPYERREAHTMKSGGTTIGTIGQMLCTALALALVANIGAAVLHIVRPESAPQVMASAIRQDEPAYMTGALGSWRGTLPRARSISIVDRITVEGRPAPQDGVWAGQFDPVTGAIEVIRSAGDLTLATVLR